MSATVVSILDYVNTPYIERIPVAQLQSDATLNEVIDHDHFLVSADEYNQLLKDSQMLAAAMQAGLEEWCYFDEVMANYKAMEKENE